MAIIPSFAAASAAAARLRFLSSSPHFPSELLLQAASISPTHPNNTQQRPTMAPIAEPKRIIFLRHGQAMHNPRAEVAHENGCSFQEFLQLMHEDDVYDATLTPLGEEQAKSAGMQPAVREALQRVDMIVSSPLSRAIRTADLVYSNGKGPKRVAIEHFREINGKLLNAKRRPRDELENIFPHWNFANVPRTDETWTEELEPQSQCGERGYQGLLWLMQQKESNILLVSHGGLLKMMMNDHPRVVLVDGRDEGSKRCVSKRFDNCELRSYVVSMWNDEFNDGGRQINGDKCSLKQPIITLEEISMDRQCSSL